MSYDQHHLQNQHPNNSAAIKPPVRPSYTSDDFNGSDYVCMTGASGSKNRPPPPEMTTTLSRTPPKSRTSDVPTMANIAISNSTAIGSPKHHTSMASSATTPLLPMRYGGDVREESSDNELQSHSRNVSSIATSPTPSQTSSGSGKSGESEFAATLICAQIHHPWITVYFNFKLLIIYS